MKQILCTVTDPVRKMPLKIALVKTSDVEIPPFQRDLSDSLVKQLEIVIDELGYIHPIVLVENQEKFYVIDGQHRLAAVRNLGISEILAIIVPEELAQKILKFNTEKPPTIRDKAKQAYRLYMDFVKTQPETTEEELSLIIPDPIFITLGVTLEEKNPKFPAGFYDDFLKKIDHFLDSPIHLALEERRNRADALLDLNEALNEKYAELNLDNPLVKGELLRKAVQQAFGVRVRTINSDFYSAIKEVKKALISLDYQSI